MKKKTAQLPPKYDPTYGRKIVVPVPRIQATPPSRPEPPKSALLWASLEKVDLTKPPFSTSKTLPEWIRECWRNEVVWVQVKYHETAYGQVKHLLIGRMDGQPIHAWYILQNAKNEVAGKECEAVEIYPPNSELFDAANIYHLFCLPPGVRLPFGVKMEDRGQVEFLELIQKKDKES